MFPFLLVFSYLFGSIPFGFILVKLRKGIDIRTVGSGNIGATNVKRVLGWPAAILVYILDAAKGVIPVWLSMYVFSLPNWQTTLIGVVVILGHLFPIFLGLKGGKAVSTISGVFLVLNPLALEIAFLVWLLIYFTTKYSSLSALTAAFAIPIVQISQTDAWSSQNIPVTIFSIAILIIVLYTHRTNISRLLKGRESKA